MIKFKILLIIFLSISTISNAQQKMKYRSIDKSILSIPDSLISSTQDLANYINSNFVSEDNKVRAVFVWITENIKYDTENMYSFNVHTDNIINRTIKTRKGICQNYAGLFHDITSKIGIKSYVVLGYTKDQGLVNYNPHVWCVAMIDSSWYIFDPTWGAGLIKDSEFIKKFNDDYFKMCPKKSIKSHMPFDPLWQCLDYPITNQAFCQGWKKVNTGKIFFNYRDSLRDLETQSYIERLIATKKRIQSNKINSYLIYNRIQQLDAKIQTYYDNNFFDRYNLAKNSYNDGIYLLNRFIDYRNDHFFPDKGDSYLKQKLIDIEDAFKVSKEYLDSIENPDSDNLSLMNHLYRSIEATMINVHEQKLFLDKFLRTSKNYRKSLFYDKM